MNDNSDWAKTEGGTGAEVWVTDTFLPKIVFHFHRFLNIAVLSKVREILPKNFISGYRMVLQLHQFLTGFCAGFEINIAEVWL